MAGGVGVGGIRRHTSGRYRETLMLTFWPCEWLRTPGTNFGLSVLCALPPSSCYLV